MPSAVQQVHSAGNVLNVFSQLAGGNPIAGKNINEYPFVIVLFPLRFALQKRRMIFPDFGEILCEIRICSCVLQNIPLWRSFIPDGKKLFIVLSRHHQVNIIVPRNKALMPHSANQRTIMPENTAGRAPCRLGGSHPVFLALLPRSAAGLDLMLVPCSYVLSLPQIVGRILEEACYNNENNDSNGKGRND